MTTPDEESGSTLRQKLEAAIAEANAWKSQAIGLAGASHKGIKADDFEGVAPDQFSAKAKEIAEARAAEREALLKEALAERFGPDVDLDSVLSNPASQPADDGAAARIASLGSLGGSPPSAVSTPVDPGRDRIAAALASQK